MRNVSWTRAMGQSSPYAINARTPQFGELSADRLCQNHAVRKVSKTTRALRSRPFGQRRRSPVPAICIHDKTRESSCIGDAQTVRPLVVSAGAFILPTVDRLPHSMPRERGIDALG